jgi:hypothetical protein
MEVCGTFGTKTEMLSSIIRDTQSIAYEQGNKNKWFTVREGNVVLLGAVMLCCWGRLCCAVGGRYVVMLWAIMLCCWGPLCCAVGGRYVVLLGAVMLCCCGRLCCAVRSLGRPRRRWEDNIKMDLQEV